VKGARDSVAVFTALDGISGSAQITAMPDLDPKDKTTISQERFTGGTGGTEVLFYVVTGGGHMDPSISEQYAQFVRWVLGRQSHDMENRT